MRYLVFAGIVVFLARCADTHQLLRKVKVVLLLLLGTIHRIYYQGLLKNMLQPYYLIISVSISSNTMHNDYIQPAAKSTSLRYLSSGFLSRLM